MFAILSPYLLTNLSITVQAFDSAGKFFVYHDVSSADD